MLKIMGCEILKKWMVFLALLFPAAVIANPIFFDPFSWISWIRYFIVLGSAFGLEAAIVTIILLFCYMEPIPLFIALLAGNVVIYFIIFRQVLSVIDNIPLAEAIIVIIEGIFIKSISLFDRFQEAEFQGLKWRTAYIAAIAGNVISYYVGVVIGR